MLEKYGSEAALSDVHHYETIELRDEFNRTVLESGLEVDADFTFTYTPLNGTQQTISAAGPVSNYTYETLENDAKRVIRILKPEFLGALLSDMRSIMKYNTSSQFLDRSTKVTYNPKEFGV